MGNAGSVTGLLMWFGRGDEASWEPLDGRRETDEIYEGRQLGNRAMLPDTSKCVKMNVGWCTRWSLQGWSSAGHGLVGAGTGRERVAVSLDVLTGELRCLFCPYSGNHSLQELRSSSFAARL